MSRWCREHLGGKLLSDPELLELIDLDIPVESEDDLEDEDDDFDKDDHDPPVDMEDIVESPSDEEDNYPAVENSIQEDYVEAPENSSQILPNVIPSGRASHQRTAKKERIEIRWEKGNLNYSEENKSFLGNADLPQNILDLETPYQFFKYFFSDDLLDKLAAESSLYSTQQNPNRPEAITKDDVQKYLGICIFTSVSYSTNVRDYWSNTTGSDFVKGVMPINKFEKIRSSLHFNDNQKQAKPGQIGFDKLYKIRPILDSLQLKFLSIPMEESLSVDEQICATKVRHHLKQYMQNKPHKWGFKLFFLCGISGYAYKFEVYTGQENESTARPTNEPDIGASSNVVVRLARSIPKHKNHKLYFDNYYTSVPLMIYLHKQGILPLGTVKRNRIPQCKLPAEHEFKKEPRGKSSEFIAVVDGVQISSLSWKDNKIVNLLSTFCGQQPETTVRRFDRKLGEHKEIRCPQVVQIYNKHMGGVDLLDSHIGRHRMKLKSKKWYFRLFYHLVDLALVNSWILYRRACAVKSTMQPMNQKDFRIEITQCLCQLGRVNAKRGRPTSGIHASLEMKRKKKSAAIIPPVDVRKDSLDHWPEWMETRGRCKHPSCKSLT